MILEIQNFIQDLHRRFIHNPVAETDKESLRLRHRILLVYSETVVAFTYLWTSLLSAHVTTCLWSSRWTDAAAPFKAALDCPAEEWDAKQNGIIFTSKNKRETWFNVSGRTVFDDRKDVQHGSQLIQTADGLRVQRRADFGQKRPERETVQK